MNVIRLTGLYALTCVIGLAANIALLGFPEVLWVAAPILMLGGMILSVPFFRQIFRALRTGNLPVAEITPALRWLRIANFALIALFVLIFFIRRSA